MTRVLAVALVCLAGGAHAQSASDYFARPGSDYSVCLVGHAIIVLNNLAEKNPITAIEVAETQCPPPKTLDTSAAADEYDYAYDIVEQVAGALNR